MGVLDSYIASLEEAEQFKVPAAAAPPAHHAEPDLGFRAGHQCFVPGCEGRAFLPCYDAKPGSGKPVLPGPVFSCEPHWLDPRRCPPRPLADCEKPGLAERYVAGLRAYVQLVQPAR